MSKSVSHDKSVSIQKRRAENRTTALFLAPALLHLFVFALVPIGYAFYISLFKWQLFKPEAKFTGLENYVKSFGEPAFWGAMWNSFRFALLSVPASMAVALLVAILVNQKLRGIAIFRTLYYVPSISSGIAVAMLWIYVFLPEQGLLNMMLKMLGIPNIDFLQRTEWAMPALAFMSIWVGLGPKMVIYLAGLVGIPQSLYEAAELDGASPTRSFLKITLPMLGPTTLFVLVTSTISAMQVFTPIYLMTKGGPEGSTDVIGYHIYSEAWVSFNTGLASAKSFVLLLIIAAISLGQFRLMRTRMEGYGA